jgi:hypothetical protein
MRAGEIENVGGGGNANTGDFTFSNDTITNNDGMKLTTNRGTLAMGTDMEVPGVAQHFHIAFDGSNSNPPASDLFLGDDNNYVKLPGYELNPTSQFGVEIGTDNRNLGPQNIEVFTVDELVPPGGVWRFFIDHEDYPNLGSSVSVGDTVTTSWGTPITATITDVIEEPGNQWIIAVAQDITAGFSGGDTVSFGASGLSHTWRFGTDGDLSIPPGKTIRDAMTGDDLLAGGGSSTHIEYTDDESEYTSTIDLTYDFNVDVDNAHLDINGDGYWSIGSNNFDTKIFSADNALLNDPLDIVVRANDNNWTFRSDGDLAIPPGKTIRDAMTGDDLLAGGGTAADSKDRKSVV